jgi:hypothetical protein
LYQVWRRDLSPDARGPLIVSYRVKLPVRCQRMSSLCRRKEKAPVEPNIRGHYHGFQAFAQIAA